jgi:hypothetical protein
MAGPDRQPDADEDRPWERPGAVRRDVAPHRGHWFRLLRWCNMVALALGVGSIPLGFATVQVAGLAGVAVSWALPLLVGVLALALGLPTWLLAARDLARMGAGAMDPAGEADARRARDVGAATTLLGLYWVACCALLPLVRGL